MSELLPQGPIDLQALGGADTLEAIERARCRYGELVRLARPRGEVWLVAGPGLARAVLAGHPEDFGKGTPPHRGRGLHTVLGEGLLTTGSRARHLHRRRLLQPAFTRERLHALTPAVVEAAGARIAGWPARSGGTAGIEVYAELEALAAETLQRLLFGRVLEGDAGRRLRLPLATGVARAGEARAARAAVDAVLTAEIGRRARNPMPGGVADVLGLLLAARERGDIDQRGVLDEMATLVLAGVETTASATAFALALLARSPRRQRAVAREVDRALRGRRPGGADLRRLPWTAAVLDEALRLFPSIPAAPRRARRDSLLGGRLVPAGTRLLVSIHALHRHPGHWRAPAAFLPERFLEGETGTRSAYLPFGVGAHVCLGRELARLVGRMAVALVAQRLVLRAPEGEALGRELAVGLTPAGGTRLAVRPRAVPERRPAA